MTCAPRCTPVTSSACRSRRRGLRIDAGDAPAALATARSRTAPIVPAAVVPYGRLGALIGSWEVRFGRLVTLRDPYDPDDPLAAGRFADAMQEAVAALLSSTTRR